MRGKEELNIHPDSGVEKNFMHHSSKSPQSMPPFDWQPRTRLVFGAGTLGHLGELAVELGRSRVVVITDQGIASAGHVDRAVSILQASGLQVSVFDQVRENPTTLDVDRALDVTQEGKADLIVGLGGGSSMDTAKGCNFLYTNGGRMADYWGVGKSTREMLPMIAIPTTAGTGSECQSAALIADEVTHQKMACLDLKAAPRVAILDPELTLSQPPSVKACTGIDAIAHAVESAVTTKRSALSQMFSREALRLCLGAFERTIAVPDDLTARAEMQLGAAYAGFAIEYSMLGGAHSGANPLTAHHGVPHGQAVGLLLPSVIRFNAALETARADYTALGATVGLADSEHLASKIEALLAKSGLAARLSQFGVLNTEMLGIEAAKQWTANFNPREITPSDFARIYESLL